MSDAFQEAATRVKGLKKSPSQDELKELYALYKQGTVGDVTGSRPGMLKLVERAKYDAWAGKKGMSQADAQAKYVAYVDGLIKRLG